MADPDIDPRVNAESRQITFTRDPEFSSRVAAYYPYEDTEQDVIKQTMTDMLRQHERGLTPEDLLAKLEAFVSESSGEFRGRVDKGSVRLECETTGAAIVLSETDDGEELSIDVRVSISDEE